MFGNEDLHRTVANSPQCPDCSTLRHQLVAHDKMGGLLDVCTRSRADSIAHGVLPFMILKLPKKLHDRAARIFTVTTVEYGSIAPRSQLIFPSRPNISRMIIARPYFTPRIANFEATSTGCCSNLAKLKAPTWKMNPAPECGAVGQLATKALAEVRNDK